MTDITPKNIVRIWICGRAAYLWDDRSWTCSSPVLRASLERFTADHWPSIEDPMPARSLARLLKKQLGVRISYVTKEVVTVRV